MTAFPAFRSPVVCLPAENIDTDQIFPARFLKRTDRQALGRFLFYDWRFDADGCEQPDFPLNQKRHRQAVVLVAGDNFGCGSSREHAAWALADRGFRAILSTRFADIFRNNALKNGLLPVTVAAPIHRELLALASDASIEIDLAATTLAINGGSTVSFTIDDFARHCLLAGVDELGYLLCQEPEIEAYEKHTPAPISTARTSTPGNAAPAAEQTAAS